MNVTKLDIAEAIIGDSMKDVRFQRGEVVACVGWVPYSTLGGIPLVLRDANTPLGLVFSVFQAGTTREDTKKTLCDTVDRIFDTLEVTGRG